MFWKLLDSETQLCFLTSVYDNDIAVQLCRMTKLTNERRYYIGLQFLIKNLGVLHVI